MSRISMSQLSSPLASAGIFIDINALKDLLVIIDSSGCSYLSVTEQSWWLCGRKEERKEGQVPPLYHPVIDTVTKAARTWCVFESNHFCWVRNAKKKSTQMEFTQKRTGQKYSLFFNHVFTKVASLSILKDSGFQGCPFVPQSWYF